MSIQHLENSAMVKCGVSKLYEFHLELYPSQIKWLDGIISVWNNINNFV